MMPNILIAVAILALYFGGMGAGFLLGHSRHHDAATIGGTPVHELACEEDEVISWVGIDTLDCVHFEDVAKERR